MDSSNVGPRGVYQGHEDTVEEKTESKQLLQNHLLEIVGGWRHFEVLEETGGKVFSDWAFEECCRGNVAGIIDIRLHGSEIDMLQVEKAGLASFWCIQEQASLRPSMGKVLQMLEGIVEIQRPPSPKPAADGNSSCASRDDA